jgi:hypothetical protein
MPIGMNLQDVRAAHALLAAVVLATVACDATKSPPAPAPTGRTEVVVFDRQDFTIDRWEKPVRPPVLPGSVPSPVTMASDAPGIVSVEENGDLVAHANGTTIVRSVGSGSALRVSVAQTESLRLVFPRHSLEEGQSTTVHALADGDLELPGTSVRWFITAPDVAIVSQSGVLTARASGQATLIGQYGGQEARVPFGVVSRRVPAFTVRPVNPHLSVGGVMSFQAVSPAGVVDARWSASSPQVATALGGAIFRAGQPGQSEVCANAGSRRACTTLEVTR